MPLSAAETSFVAASAASPRSLGGRSRIEPKTPSSFAYPSAADKGATEGGAEAVSASASASTPRTTTRREGAPEAPSDVGRFPSETLTTRADRAPAEREREATTRRSRRARGRTRADDAKTSVACDIAAREESVP